MCTPEARQAREEPKPEYTYPEKIPDFTNTYFADSWDPAGKQKRYEETVRQSYRDYQDGKIQKKNVMSVENLRRRNNAQLNLWNINDTHMNPQPPTDPAFYLTQDTGQNKNTNRRALKIRGNSTVKTANRKSKLGRSSGSGGLRKSMNTLNI